MDPKRGKGTKREVSPFFTISCVDEQSGKQRQGCDLSRADSCGLWFSPTGSLWFEEHCLSRWADKSQNTCSAHFSLSRLTVSWPPKNKQFITDHKMNRSELLLSILRIATLFGSQSFMLAGYQHNVQDTSPLSSKLPV